MPSLRWPGEARLGPVCLLLAGAASLPCPVIGAPVDYLDDSWQLGLYLAHRMGLHWGTQVIWTYGPLGWLLPAQPWFGDQWLAAQAALLLTHLLFLVAIAGHAHGGPIGWRWILGIAALAPVGMLPTTYFPATELEVALAAVLLVAAALRRGPPGSLLLAALAGFSLAFLGLFKGTGLVVGLSVVGIGTALAVASRPAVALALPVTYLATWLGLWLACGQQVVDASAYLCTTFAIAGGFTEAMSIGGSDVWTVLGAALVVGFAAAGVIAAAARAGPLLRLLLLLGPIVLVYFKEGFVRYEVRHAAVFFSLALMGACVALIEIGRAGSAPPRLAGPPLAMIAVAAAVALLAGAGPPLELAHHRVHGYRLALQAATDPAYRDQQSRALAAQARAAYALPDDVVADLRTGTVDVLPWDVAAVHAYGLRWDPRPVLQSYAAFAPELDAADADHFRGARAPDHVLYYFAGIDGRYPLFDEPLTVRTLIENYRVQATFSGGLLLERRPQPLPDDARAEGGTCVATGAAVAVPHPDGRYVYAAVDVPLAIPGRLAELALKVPPPAIRLGLGAGSESPDFRLVRATAADGLLVSDYAAGAADVADLLAGHPAHRVLALTVDGPAPAYAGTTCIRFFSVAAPV